MSIRASIDLGTNTCLLLIARLSDQGQVAEILEDHHEIVRLGEKVDQNRKLLPQAMERAKVCLLRYLERVKAHGIPPSQVIAIATSSSRDSENGEEFFKSIEKETGFQFRIISGEEEARASFLGGLLSGMDPSTHGVVDVGGGSTEFVAMTGKSLIAQSLDIGSVRFTERHLKSDPVTDQEFWNAREAIDQELKNLELCWEGKSFSQTTWVAVAGTAATLGAWHLGLRDFDARRIDGTVLLPGDLHRMVEELKWRNISERSALPGVEAARAPVLLAGALILWRSCEVLKIPKMVVSTRGIRFGVFVKN